MLELKLLGASHLSRLLEALELAISLISPTHPPLYRVVTRTFSDGRTDGRTDDRTMAVGASVTWTHCSVLFEVTWGKTAAYAR
jgi:hypothetical protein